MSCPGAAPPTRSAARPGTHGLCARQRCVPCRGLCAVPWSVCQAAVCVPGRCLYARPRLACSAAPYTVCRAAWQRFGSRGKVVSRSRSQITWQGRVTRSSRGLYARGQQEHGNMANFISRDGRPAVLEGPFRGAGRAVSRSWLGRLPES